MPPPLGPRPAGPDPVLPLARASATRIGEGLGDVISNQGLPNFLPGFLGGGDNGVLHGDFGYSTTSGEPVSQRDRARACCRPRSSPGPRSSSGSSWRSCWESRPRSSATARPTRRSRSSTTSGISFPTFWLGLMLIIVFAGQLQWLPAGGMWDARTTPIFGTPEYWAFVRSSPFAAFTDLGAHLILPVITLVVVNIAGDSRFIRASMIDALNQDYVRTARAKGVAENVGHRRHALRNALLPVVTNIGLELPFLFAGAIVTETIFSWPGMGRAFIEAVGNYDYPVLMGILVITAVIVVASQPAGRHRLRASSIPGSAMAEHEHGRPRQQCPRRDRGDRHARRRRRTTTSSSSRSASGSSPGGASSSTGWRSSAPRCSSAMVAIGIVGPVHPALRLLQHPTCPTRSSYAGRPPSLVPSTRSARPAASSATCSRWSSTGSAARC